MRFHKAARRILGVTALAWSIPFAQAADARQPALAELQAKCASSVKDVKDGLQVRD